ncbi:PCI domain containing protein [Tritrichomonas foetus]|uniref:PCI domain containing protein n=1 Tax=Tritrichomonas foetus TaxID=1144522 RepID=A0A1J4JLQ1_9EUKA|nr:PCI domain containing protein [Tritrichomonas foetus]|eukprot:OHS99335.1 PCI domain containing protein [Tritrichomonas foetus]
MSQIKTRVSNAIDNQDAFILGQYFDFNYLTNSRQFLQQFIGDSNLRQIQPQFWSDIIKNLIESTATDNLKKSFESYSQAVNIFIRSVNIIELKVPITKVIARSLLSYARNGLVNESDRLLSQIFSDVAKLSRQKLFDSPLLAVINATLSVRLLTNNYNLADKLLDQCSKMFKIDPTIYTTSELASYYYLKGKIEMVYERQKEAFHDLRKSLDFIPLNQKKDRRLVLAHFIPVSLSFGILPTEQLLQEYDLGIYCDFTKALETGDIRLFDNAFEVHQITLIRLGVLEMMAHAKKIVERRLLELVCLSWHQVVEKKNIIPIEAFVDAVNLASNTEISFDDAIIMLANLSYEKLVKMNIAYGPKKIIFAPNDTFPQPDISLDSD